MSAKAMRDLDCVWSKLVLLGSLTVTFLSTPCQTSSGPVAPNAAVSASPSPQTSAYEVATIKPPGPEEYAMPLRVYIQSAYAIPVNSTGWVVGPDWINTARYVIQAKPPESTREAMRTMTPQEQGKQARLMQQSLLAERFKLKAHLETREMPVYQLIVAKGGHKMKENPDLARGQAAVGRAMIRGTDVPVQALADMLETVPDVGGRIVVDKTGLSGNYDYVLKWLPLDEAAPPTSRDSRGSVPDDEGVSLFTAIEEQLGLRLVPIKEQGQVLVIDHIERPTEN